MKQTLVGRRVWLPVEEEACACYTSVLPFTQRYKISEHEFRHRVCSSPVKLVIQTASPPLSVGSALLEAKALKPVSSCSLLISPSLPSSCRLSMASSSCPTEDHSAGEDIFSIHKVPATPHLPLTTKKPPKKGSQMLTWRTGHTWEWEHVWGERWALMSGTAGQKAHVWVTTRGIKQGQV